MILAQICQNMILSEYQDYLADLTCDTISVVYIRDQDNKYICKIIFWTIFIKICKSRLLPKQLL